MANHNGERTPVFVSHDLIVRESARNSPMARDKRANEHTHNKSAMFVSRATSAVQSVIHFEGWEGKGKCTEIREQ